MDALNPDKQVVYCSEPSQIRKCFTACFPTLSELKQAYGPGAPSAWLVPQITNLSEYCGSEEKISKEQIKELSIIISHRHSYLKCSELMLFFYNFKAAKYGKFYKKVDPMKIMSALLTFCDERIKMLDKIDEEKRKQEIEERDRNAVPYEKFLAVLEKHKDEGIIAKEAQKSVSDALSIAKGIIATQTDEEHAYKMISTFKKKYGVTPQEYIENHKTE